MCEWVIKYACVCLVVRMCVPVSDKSRFSSHHWTMASFPWYSPVFTTNITNPFIKLKLPLTYKRANCVLSQPTSSYTYTYSYLSLSNTTASFQSPKSVPVSPCDHMCFWLFAYVRLRMCTRPWMLRSCVFAQTYSEPVWVAGHVPMSPLLTHISYFRKSVTALFPGASPECFAWPCRS